MEQRRARILSLVFTDLADSTALKTQRGDAAIESLMSRHVAHVTRLAAECNGRIIKWAGDGCLLTFEASSSAVLFALQLEMAHAEEPDLPGVRIGMHMGEVTETLGDDGPPDVIGLAVDLASRICGLARPGQILMSATVYDSARQRIGFESLGKPILWQVHGSYSVKGYDKEIQIGEARIEGIAALATPVAGERTELVRAPDTAAVRRRRGWAQVPNRLVWTGALVLAALALWTWYTRKSSTAPDKPQPTPTADLFADVRMQDVRKEAIRLQTHSGHLEDRLRARDLFRQCADRGDRIANMWIARNMFHGLSVYAQDVPGAVKIAREEIGFVCAVASSGSSEAQFLAGVAYQHGIGVKPDLEKAADYYRDAIDSDEPIDLAMANLADMYAFGVGVERDGAVAVDLFKRAIDLGLPRAMKRLGDLYRDGEFVEKDSEKALMWYGKSAELEYAAGMYSLAMMYIEGDAPRDYQEAANLLYAAARDGSPMIWYELGKLYNDGLLDEEDTKEMTVKYWKKAAKDGVKEAQDALREMGITNW